MKRHAAALMLVLAFLGLAWAAGDTGGFQPVSREAVASGYLASTAAGTYRDTLSTGDNADLDAAAVAMVQSLTCGGKTTVAVSATFSASAATTLIEVVRYRGTEIRGYSQAILTAVTSAPTTGGRYPSQTVYFDTGNCDLVKILLRGNPSSGNVTLKADIY